MNQNPYQPPESQRITRPLYVGGRFMFWLVAGSLIALVLLATAAWFMLESPAPAPNVIPGEMKGP